MWNDVNVSLPEDEGDYLVYQTPDNKNFHMAVVWYNPYSLHGGWGGNNYFVYYWQALPAEPHLTPTLADEGHECDCDANNSYMAYAPHQPGCPAALRPQQKV
jgi:hypothetical protein